MLLEDKFFEIVSVAEENGLTEVKVRLNPDHRIYRAHFPGYPVTPGVCIVEIAVEVASVITGKKLVLNGAKDIKFLVPVIPTETGELVFEYAAPGVVKVYEGETVFAKMKLNLE